VAGLGEKFGERRLDWFHPGFELAFLELRFAQGGRSLEHEFLAGGLEIHSHRLLERRFVLGKQLCHPIELFDAPFVAARDARRE
jgi:hypothetical protein